MKLIVLVIVVLVICHIMGFRFPPNVVGDFFTNVVGAAANLLRLVKELFTWIGALV